MRRDSICIQTDIRTLKQHMALKEFSDNFYYTSGRRADDLRRLAELEKELENAGNG